MWLRHYLVWRFGVFRLKGACVRQHSLSWYLYGVWCKGHWPICFCWFVSAANYVNWSSSVFGMAGCRFMQTRGRSAQDPPNPSRRLYFLRTPFSTKMLTAQEKIRNAIEELLHGFHLLHTWSMSGTCLSSYTSANLRKIEKFPYFNSQFGDIHRWKAECAMICHLSKLYMAMIINRCCRVNTLVLTHRRR